MRLARAVVLFVALSLLVAMSSCSSSSAPHSSGTAAVCTSVQQLKASAAKLTNVDISANALSTLRTDLNDIKRSLQAVSRDAGEHYSSDVEMVRSAASDVQAAATTVQNDPSATAVASLAAKVKTLASTVTALADKVGSTC